MGLPGHAPELRRPHAGGVDDMVGADRAVVRDDLPGAVPGPAQIAHPHAPMNRRPRHPRGLGQGLGHARRVDIPVVGRVPGGQQAVRRDVGVQLLDPVGLDDLEFEAEMARQRLAAEVFGEARLRLGEPQAAGDVKARGLAGHLLEPLVEADRVRVQADEGGAAAEMGDEGGGAPGGAGTQLALLQENRIGAAALGELEQHVGARHAAADDDDASLLR